MTWTLNDTVVTEEAYSYYQSIKRSGGKISLMLLGEYGLDAPNLALCKNCDGVGEIVLETITGGPALTPIRVEPNTGDTTTWINEQWYKRRLTSYTCIPCHGTGRMKPHKEAE